MGLRLTRRGPATAGRHSRAVPGPLVPGAAAALVASADHWDDAVAAPTAYDGSAQHPAAELPVAPVLLEVAVAAPAAAPPAPDPVPQPEPALVPALAGVSLGFADGAQVDLPADDPRVRTFRAAAAALLESPRS